jgi:hypothetical protein
VEFVSSLFDEINTNSIQSLWKDFKSEIRKSRTTSKYIFAISRFFFHKMLSQEEQIKLLVESMQTESIDF